MEHYLRQSVRKLAFEKLVEVEEFVSKLNNVEYDSNVLTKEIERESSFCFFVCHVENINHRYKQIRKKN